MTNKVQIITIKSEFESVKQLGFPTLLPENDLFLKDFKDTVVIRWGNSMPSYQDENSYLLKEFEKIINYSSSIRRNCEKHFALEKLSEVVDTPKIFLKKVPNGEKVVVRKFAHSHGSDFAVLSGPLSLEKGFYATSFIETDTEYRVWFCGESIFTAKRVALTEEDEKAFPCRSNWGYKYCQNIPELTRKTLLAAKAIGLEVGAADVLYTKKLLPELGAADAFQSEEKFVFLELNSAPSIDTNALIKFFKNGLTKLIESKFPNGQP